MTSEQKDALAWIARMYIELENLTPDHYTEDEKKAVRKFLSFFTNAYVWG